MGASPVVQIRYGTLLIILIGGFMIITKCHIKCYTVRGVGYFDIIGRRSYFRPLIYYMWVPYQNGNFNYARADWRLLRV